ncbi:DUF4179 domain-containing protein [Gordonibacter urolithinfaciens]|uniref:DUF4179 domain-containing protein n=1 Tax=Gordonibacter urolithinfaciens TaxID=1335613 RepID=UPI003AB00C54
MSHEKFGNESELRQAVICELDPGPLPQKAQAKLDGVYASLGSIPQDRPTAESAAASERPRPTRLSDAEAAAHGKPTGGRVVRRGVLMVAAAVTVALLGGAAFAATTLLQMQPGDAPFFDSGKNLPIYGSLQEGVSSLSADVGQTVEVDGVKVTLDSVSSDRNIVNLFFTLEKEGGFDLTEQASYKGSQESEWDRLQRLSPRFTCALSSNGESIGSDSVYLLDAYREDGKVKVMQRIVPEATLPDQVDIELGGWATWKPYEEGDEPFTFDFGLDLGTVAQPRELGSQDLTFATSEGEKIMGIERFTASELGCVMVVRNDEIETIEESGRPIYNVAEGSITPSMLKIADDLGNVLTPVGAGDGTGIDPAGAYVVELAGLSPDAASVTFTPMMHAADWESMTDEQRGDQRAERAYGGRLADRDQAGDERVRRLRADGLGRGGRHGEYLTRALRVASAVRRCDRHAAHAATDAAVRGMVRRGDRGEVLGLPHGGRVPETRLQDWRDAADHLLLRGQRRGAARVDGVRVPSIVRRISRGI